MEHKDPADGTLVFVYNADSGWQHAVMDTLHKYLRPDTYSCNLCRITHGAIGPKQAWKDFLEECGRPVHFLHRDEFSEFPAGASLGAISLPAILELRGGKAEVLMEAQQLNRIDRLDNLLQLLQAHLRDP